MTFDAFAVPSPLPYPPSTVQEPDRAVGASVASNTHSLDVRTQALLRDYAYRALVDRHEEEAIGLLRTLCRAASPVSDGVEGLQALLDRLALGEALAYFDRHEAALPLLNAVRDDATPPEWTALAERAGRAAALSLTLLDRAAEALALLDAGDTTVTAQPEWTQPAIARVLVRVRVLLALHRPGEALAALAPALALLLNAAPSGVVLGYPDPSPGGSAATVPSDTALHPLDATGIGLQAMRRDAHLLQAAAFLSLQQPMRAVTALEGAFATDADDPSALVLFGQALASLGQFAFAVDRFERALQVRPDFAPAYRYMASALAMQRMDEPALTCLRAARRLRPDWPTAWLDEAGIRLRRGELARGFEAYEWREGTHRLARRTEAYWCGDDALSGQSIVVLAEQGLGDTLHFIRYVAMLAPLAREVVVEVQPPLARLIASAAARGNWGVQVIARGDPRPETDRFCFLMSLPYAMRTRLDTIPADVPYLHAAIALQQGRTEGNARGSAHERHVEACDPAYRTRAEADGGAPAPPTRATLRVALVPSGNAEYRNDAMRSIPLQLFAPLFSLAGVEFTLLQAAPRPADLAWLKTQGRESLSHGGDADTGIDRPTHDGSASAMPPLRRSETQCALRVRVLEGDFADSAQTLLDYDLVISVDTAMAHLAGALGRDVWILLPHVPDWRWLYDRDDSPWYPTARLFRQPHTFDWPAVIDAVKQALARYSAGPERDRQSR